MKTTCKECGSKIDVEVPTDETLLNRITALENKTQPQNEDLATHLNSCPNCDKVIRDKVKDTVKKTFDVEELEDEDDDEEKDEED